MKKYFFSHPVLAIGGSLFTLLFYALYVWFCYLSIFKFKEVGVWGVIDVIIFSPLCVFWHIRMVPHIFGMIKISNESIMFYGLFLPVVKIKCSNIKYVEIRTFKEKNVMQGQNTTDAYKFILLSTSPLPRKRIDKVRSSKKKRIIKFAVSQKLCQALVECLSEEKTGCIKHQLHLYQRSRK